MRVQPALLALLALTACARSDEPDQEGIGDNAVVGPAAPGPPYAQGTGKGTRYVPCPDGHRPKRGDPHLCVPVAAVPE